MPTVLLADDEPIVRQLLREILSIDSTLSFVEANNGVAALEVAHAVYPHLIVLDIMMPKMDGLQVCRLLKADPQLRAIPIVIVTALNTPGGEVAASEAGADAFLKKSFDEDKLLATVARLLECYTT